MPPIKEFQCGSCGHVQEELVLKPEDIPEICPQCQSHKLYTLPSVIGGYQGDLGSASTRPKAAGSPKRRK